MLSYVTHEPLAAAPVVVSGLLCAKVDSRIKLASTMIATPHDSDTLARAMSLIP